MEIIGEQIKGKYFLGVLKYSLNPEKGRLLGGNMAGKTPHALSREFAGVRKLNPRLKRPVYHSILSLSPGEELNDYQWNQIVETYLEKMGFKNSLYVVVLHNDKDHSHVHIIASRISVDGKTISDSRDYARGEAVIREIEKNFGLNPVTPSMEASRRGLTRGELQFALKTQQQSIRMKLQTAIDSEVIRGLTFTQLVHNLKQKGVSVIPNMASNGRISGLSFSFSKSELMKGSDIGRGFTFSGLIKRGIKYDQFRDNDAFRSIDTENEVLQKINYGLRKKIEIYR